MARAKNKPRLVRKYRYPGVGNRETVSLFGVTSQAAFKRYYPDSTDNEYRSGFSNRRFIGVGDFGCQAGTKFAGDADIDFRRDSVDTGY